jgi:hypothetical protein
MAETIATKQARVLTSRPNSNTNSIQSCRGVVRIVRPGVIAATVDSIRNGCRSLGNRIALPSGINCGAWTRARYAACGGTSEVTVIIEMHEGTYQLSKVLVKHDRLTSRHLRVAGPLAHCLRLFRRKSPDVVLRGSLRVFAGAVTVDGLPFNLQAAVLDYRDPSAGVSVHRGGSSPADPITMAGTILR